MGDLWQPADCEGCIYADLQAALPVDLRCCCMDEGHAVADDGDGMRSLGDLAARVVLAINVGD